VREWYLEDVERGLTPQIARDVLPHLVKSEIFVSGRWSGWKHFIELRDSKEAHPRVRRIAQDIRNWFEESGIYTG
jgi:thymidylate synthase (FAD)